MKIVKLSILFTIMAGAAFTQSNSSIELSIQLGNSFRTISNVSSTLTGDKIIDNRNLHEQKVNYRLEIGYNKQIANDLILKTGINYSTFNYYTIKLSDLRWPSEHDGNGGWEPDPSLPREITDQVNYKFIGIPLLIRYEFNENRLSPYFEIGPNVQILSKAEFSESTNINSEVNNISNEFNPINIFGRAGIGISYGLSTTSEIFGSLNYQRQLNNLRKMDASERLYDYGFNVGLRISINRRPSDNIKHGIRLE